MSNTERIDVNRLVGQLLKLVREVEGLSTAGREYIDQQIGEVKYIFNDWIRPQISGSPEVYEMERMLRAMEDFCFLSEGEWRRLNKVRKQAIDVMRATTEVVVRRLVKEVLEHGNAEQ